MKLKRILTATILMGMIGANTTLAFANTTMPVAQSVEQKASILAGTSQIRYSDMLIDGEVWVDLNLQGAKFKDDATANEIRDAITTNYAVKTTLAVRNDRTGIEFGIFESLPNISFKDEWIITIDSSVLTVDYDLTTTIKVRDNVTSSPKVVADRTSLTRDELTRGTVVTFNIEGEKFNTACTGQYIRRSIMESANVRGLYVIPYCDLTQNKITFYMQALNGVSIHENKLTFVFDNRATSANNALPVTFYLS